MSDLFSAALDGFEARIASVERALDTGSWDDVLPWSPPAEPLGDPGPDEVERLQRLLARAEACRVRLLAALEETASELRIGRTARRAARGYLSALAG